MKMTRFEEKILDWLKEHRIILGYVLITALNLYLRKIAVWWTVDGVVSYYDGHSHMVQGQLWWLIMRAGMVFPILPVHFMKWIAAAGDFAMAAVGARALSSKGLGGKAGSGEAKGSLERGLVFYAVVLIMPFTLLRGIVWSMTDSIGIACFLWAWCFAKKDVAKCAAYVAGMLFCPALLLSIVLEALVGNWRKRDSVKGSERDSSDRHFNFAVVCGAVAATAVIAGVLGLINGFGFAEGLFGQVYFLSYEALEGFSFAEGGEWLMQQLWLYCLPVSVWGIFKILRRI